MTYERVAIVTGGASGIGLAISERLAVDGHAVVIFHLNGDAANDAAPKNAPKGGNAAAIFALSGDAANVAAAKIEATGGPAAGFAVDVTDRAAIDAGVAVLK